MNNIQNIEKSQDTFLARLNVKKLVNTDYCEKEIPDGRLYCQTHLDENGQLYYSYGLYVDDGWVRPSVQEVHKYFRLDLVPCLVVPQQGKYAGKELFVAITRKDLQKKILFDTTDN